MSRLFALLLCALLAACNALEVEEVAATPQAAPQAAAKPARRCPHCGWIESKREILPGAWEYTVRMADGSSRVFQEALPTSWRVRERLLYIDGSGGPLN